MSTNIVIIETEEELKAMEELEQKLIANLPPPTTVDGSPPSPQSRTDFMWERRVDKLGRTCLVGKSNMPDMIAEEKIAIAEREGKGEASKEDFTLKKLAVAVVTADAFPAPPAKVIPGVVVVVDEDVK